MAEAAGPYHEGERAVQKVAALTSRAIPILRAQRMVVIASIDVQERP